MTETEMALIYKQCPQAVKSLMDHSFSEQEIPENSDEKLDAIMVDFGLFHNHITIFYFHKRKSVVF